MFFHLMLTQTATGGGGGHPPHPPGCVMFKLYTVVACILHFCSLINRPLFYKIHAGAWLFFVVNFANINQWIAPPPPNYFVKHLGIILQKRKKKKIDAKDKSHSRGDDKLMFF